MASAAPESNGKSEHTEALYREHGAAVARLCLSLLRDRTEAEDATQQVFLSAHRALLAGSAPREPLAWLLAVARNECYARFRQRASAPVPAGEIPAESATADTSSHVLRAGELATVWDEVGRMPPAQREAFLLREIRGLSYGQLAAELSLSRHSVRSLLMRARARVRRRLGDIAAFGGASWVQALRLVCGGDGTSPVPAAAAKAAAVGVGALALVGGTGDVPRIAHSASTPAEHAAVRRHAGAHVRHIAVPAPVTVAPRENRSRLDDGGVSHSRGRRDERSESHERTGRVSARSSGESSGRDGGSGGSDDTAPTATTPVAQPVTAGSGGSRDGSGSSGGGGPGPGSGSDGGSTTITTTTTTTTTDSSGHGSGTSGSDGSHSGSDDGGPSSGHGG